MGRLTFEPQAVQPVDAERPKIVVAAMDLPDEALDKLRDDFGPGFVVMDLHDAPPSADIVLVHAVSPQLIASLRAMYPDAELVITELADPDYGVDFSGPVSRLLDAGATGYLPPRSIPEVASGVRRHVESKAMETGSTRAEIGSPGSVAPQEESPTEIN
ncbi:hypothetical protein GCM10027298_13050 [Epidermidibacterium keratini]